VKRTVLWVLPGMLADQPHGRRLTASERMRLDELERQLGNDDPQLAEALRQGLPPSTPRRAVVAGTAMAAAVLVLLAALAGGTTGAASMVITLVVLLAVWVLTWHRRARR
jgi:Flp pilus assembly protein TadB